MYKTMINMRSITGFISEELFYSGSEDYAELGAYSPEFRFLGFLLLIFLVVCEVVGIVMLRRQWRGTRLQDLRRNHYRGER